MPKPPKWELKCIIAHERPSGKSGDDDLYLCVWEDSVLNTFAAVQEGLREFQLEYTQRDDGKYIVKWAPTWEPGWMIRRDAHTRVREWRDRDRKKKETSSSNDTTTRHIVPEDDSDSDSNSYRSSHSPEPPSGPVMEYGTPRPNYFVRSITSLDPGDAEKGGILPSRPRDRIIEHAQFVMAVTDVELQNIFALVRGGS